MRPVHEEVGGQAVWVSAPQVESNDMTERRLSGLATKTLPDKPPRDPV